MTVTNKLPPLNAVMWLWQSYIWNSRRKRPCSKTPKYAGPKNEGIFFLNCHIHSKAHPSPSASKDEARVLLSYVIKWQTRCSTDVTGQLPIKLDFWSWAPASLSHRSSSSSGRAVVWATSKSCSYCAAKAGSMTTSGGARAGMATNSKLGSPISFLASQRKGFSKL